MNRSVRLVREDFQHARRALSPSPPPLAGGGEIDARQGILPHPCPPPRGGEGMNRSVPLAREDFRIACLAFLLGL